MVYILEQALTCCKGTSTVGVYSTEKLASIALFKLCGKGNFNCSIVQYNVDDVILNEKYNIFCPNLTLVKEGIDNWDEVWGKVMLELEYDKTIVLKELIKYNKLLENSKKTQRSLLKRKVDELMS